MGTYQEIVPATVMAEVSNGIEGMVTTMSMTMMMSTIEEEQGGAIIKDRAVIIITKMNIVIRKMKMTDTTAAVTIAVVRTMTMMRITGGLAEGMVEIEEEEEEEDGSPTVIVRTTNMVIEKNMATETGTGMARGSWTEIENEIIGTRLADRTLKWQTGTHELL